MEGGLLSLKWNNHRSSFMHVLSTLRTKEMYTDVTIACDGKFFQTHKLVLSTCSEYFQEMFQQTQYKHPVIVLKDIHCEELEALLNYMYIGEVNVVQEKLSSLIKSAECLKIKGLAVPDDPPPKVNLTEKRTLHHGCSSEKKRRKKETDYSSRENKYCSSNKSSSSSVTNLISLPTDANNSLRDCEENPVNSDMENYSSNKIKEEPLDVIEVEDSKEGILSNLCPMLSRSSENKPISESQDSWKPKNCNADEFSIMEESDDFNTEVCSMNDEELWDVSEMGPFEHNWEHSPKNSRPSTKIFQCQFCPYSIRDNTNFKRHLRIHTGEKPYVCLFCPYRSSQSNNLKSHMKSRHTK